MEYSEEFELMSDTSKEDAVVAEVTRNILIRYIYEFLHCSDVVHVKMK